MVNLLKNKFELKDELLLDYYNGIKKPCDFKIGTEIEKVNVLKNTFEAVPYSLVEQFLDVFAARYSWNRIKQNNYILGLEKDGNIISLEPGSQLEISLVPSENVHQISAYMKDFNKKVSETADFLGFYSLGYGLQPLSVYDDIRIIPKQRYDLMTDYFLDKGKMAYVMMRETAGVQVTLDYSSEEDAIMKLRLGCLLAPIISAIFSNSPIRKGKTTGYKSFRAKSWLHTDNERCGFINSKLFDVDYDFGFKDYVETLLDVPMIFVVRDNKSCPVNATFREYLANGYEGLSAIKEDWELHSNLYFPEVRLKSFLEFRNADSQNPDMILALIALYKGLFYDIEAMKDVFSLLSDVDFDILSQIRQLTPQYALDVEIGGNKILDIAKQLVFIAKKSLQKQMLLDEYSQNESIYLQILEKYLMNEETPSDRLLAVCGDDVASIVNYTKI